MEGPYTVSANLEGLPFKTRIEELSIGAGAPEGAKAPRE